ncbi:MAG TPA: hypothetical protein PK517_06165 [Nitrosomonas sp.]|nr:hypothetical protein [Nitrosomonas sp.]
MNPAIDPSFFKITAPKQDRILRRAWVQPVLFSELLNPESSLVSAAKGYGKSTLAWMTQEQTADKWLNIELDLVSEIKDDFMDTLLRQITLGIWEYAQTNPASLARLQTRAIALRHFLNQFEEVEIAYTLATLADDYPEHAETIQKFIEIPEQKIFHDNTPITQKLSVLCDCVQKLGFEAVVIWVDLAVEHSQISPIHLALLQNFFDSLYLMRRRILHIKCLAQSSVCTQLSQMRGVETLSVATLELSWQPTQLFELVNKRLNLASAGQLQSVTELVAEDKFLALLENASDVGNPSEWLILTRLIVEAVNQQKSFPLSEKSWIGVQRTYYGERVKIRMDENGYFWREKKWAIYPVMKYLYEHPGTRSITELKAALPVDEANLNTIVFRIRKEHLEPIPSSDKEDAWIYLITEPIGY